MFLFKCCIGGQKAKKTKCVADRKAEASAFVDAKQFENGPYAQAEREGSVEESGGVKSFRQRAPPSHVSPNPSLNIPFIDEASDVAVWVQAERPHEKVPQAIYYRRPIMSLPVLCSSKLLNESLPPVWLKRRFATSERLLPIVGTIDLKRDSVRNSYCSVQSEDFKTVIDSALENEHEVLYLKKLFSEKVPVQSADVPKLSAFSERTTTKEKALKQPEVTYDNSGLESILSDGLDSGVETDVSWHSNRRDSNRGIHYLSSQSVTQSRLSSILDVSSTSAVETLWPSSLMTTYHPELALYDFHITQYDEDFACINLIDWVSRLVSSIRNPLVKDEYLANLIHMMLYDCAVFHQH